MSWLYLLLAAVAEALYGIGLYHSRGFTKLWPSTLGIVAGIATTWLLALAMKGMSIGVAFVVWSGLAAIGTAIYGIAALGESRDLARLAMMGLILAGVVGLKLTST
jgi:quaternary ammonium compound-resistance protein SugE